MCLLAVSEDGHWLSCVDSKNAVNVLDINDNKVNIVTMCDASAG
jgi:(2Fe-2S) ferredoxin